MLTKPSAHALFPSPLPQQDDRSPASGSPSFSNPPFGLKPRSGESEPGRGGGSGNGPGGGLDTGPPGAPAHALLRMLIVLLLRFHFNRRMQRSDTDRLRACFCECEIIQITPAGLETTNRGPILIRYPHAGEKSEIHMKNYKPCSQPTSKADVKKQKN